MIIKTKIISFLAAMLMASAAFAQKAGDTIISVGLASVNPKPSLGAMGSDFSPFEAASSVAAVVSEAGNGAQQCDPAARKRPRSLAL